MRVKNNKNSNNKIRPKKIKMSRKNLVNYKMNKKKKKKKINNNKNKSSYNKKMIINNKICLVCMFKKKMRTRILILNLLKNYLMVQKNYRKFKKKELLKTENQSK